MALPDLVDFAKPYFGSPERQAVERVMRGIWLSNGPEQRDFELEFAKLHDLEHALVVNSGSSANLLALAALNLPKGSKVLTSGCGFPATLAPILHLGLEPVLVDYDLTTYNIDVTQAIERLSGCKAMIFAHTLGSPVDMRELVRLAERLGVPLIEDCCEAIGATLEDSLVGTWGTMGTYSFYPSHQITALGGGGMIVFRDRAHYLTAKSMRDWGKSVADPGGRSATTYETEVDGVPYFPHYTYTTLGWNFRLPEANCAFGREQLRRIPWIVGERFANRQRIVSMISPQALEILDTQRPVQGAKPSWFGVLLCLKGGNRDRFGATLESMGVAHRPFFAGNITRHKPFLQYLQPFEVADYLMRSALFVGCYAGMTREECARVAGAINAAADQELYHALTDQETG